jgi:gliding motility-associated-like protein
MYIFGAKYFTIHSMKPISHLLILFTTLVLSTRISFAQEICNNNIDDDGDRLIDLYDVEDCPCTRVDTFKISLIPNPSFEDVNCVPTGYSQLNCAEGWEQATLATTDLFSTDGFIPSSVDLPIPDGNNCVGTFFDGDIWIEYLGTCLNGPLLKDQSYLLKFNVAADLFTGQPDFPEYPVDLLLFGKTTCDPFPVQTYTCPENAGWKEIGRVNYSTKHSWTTISLFFTPKEDIYSVMLGGPCSLPPVTSLFIFWDNLQLNRADDEIIYYVPNTFTPNGDEHNNVFNPVFVCGYDPLEYRFDVYDRWGEIVFTSLDAQKGWDGTYHGLPAKEGVFGWKLEYKAENTTEKKVITGHANLLR